MKPTIGQTSVVGDDYDARMEQNRKKVAKEYPALWKGIVADHNYGDKIALQNLTEITSPSGKHKFYFVEDPGHGWYFTDKGIYIGEEDGGLDLESKESKELAQELANYALHGKACSKKEII